MVVANITKIFGYLDFIFMSGIPLSHPCYSYLGPSSLEAFVSSPDKRLSKIYKMKHTY